ncbi:MAG: gfo/Idh/MocA family oxidoreductase [Spirochaetaceae bacterium]|nr:MAG: gfo/Idh/MocA family oxidoreductase [Spirochaetaceae bacterium]
MAIRTGLIGYGRNGSTMHANPICELPEFEMVAVCDVDKAARDAAAARFGVPVYESYSQMLEKEDLDFVVVVTYNHQHASMAAECLEAGVDVLVTKPWAVNQAEAAKMIETAKKAKKLLLPWLPSRWGCQLAKLREVIAAGEIGKVYRVERRVTTFGRRADWQTRSDHAGGYLLNWGPHIVDQPVQLLGERVESVYARMSQVVNPGDVEDVFSAVLTLDGGETIQCDHIVASGDSPEWVVYGDRGTITVHNKTLEVHQVRFEENIDPSAYRSTVNKTVRTEEASGAVYGDEMEIYREIATALRRETVYPITLESGLYLTKLLDAIRLSAAEDVVVNVAVNGEPANSNG